jgi:hypothetical protein
MTDELQPRPEPEPLPDPVVEDLDDEDEGIELVEPRTATRLSPYAIAAFAVSLLGLFDLGSALRGALFLNVGFASHVTHGPAIREILFNLSSLVAPMFAGAFGMWLAAKAENEIFEDEPTGVFGGVGLYRAAWFLGMALIAITVLAVFASLIAPQPVMSSAFGN